MTQAARDDFASQIFGLSDESVGIRNRWRLLLAGAVWLLLSGMTMLFTVFFVELPVQRGIVIGLSFLKYIPVLFAAYALAKGAAARYLDDIFELHDEALARDFIEEAAFGGGREYIVINEGRISESDERSPIILIGGPGQIQVNLGSAALLEKVDGTPEVIHAHGEPWRLGRFERIREIGKHDEVGKREYAVVNLRDQYLHGLSVRTRTRDGIPIEAQDINLQFSVRRSKASPRRAQADDPFLFDKDALRDIVYKQTTITPSPSPSNSVEFPWESTVIPLVITELQRFISSRDMGELRNALGQKEIELINENEETVAQLRSDLIGGAQTVQSRTRAHSLQGGASMDIAQKFLTPAFHKKAWDLGVAIHWVDIGTWRVTSGIVSEKIKAGWDLTGDNNRRKTEIERLSKKLQTDELVELINQVVIACYEKNTAPLRLTARELQAMKDWKPQIETDPNFEIGSRLERLLNQGASKMTPLQVVGEILSAFRREFIAARDLLQRDERDEINLEDEVELRQDISRIDKALREIDAHIPY